MGTNSGLYDVCSPRSTCHEIVMAWSTDDDAHKSLDRVK